MSIWTLRQLQNLTIGRWLIEPQDDQAVSDGISIDTRTIQTGNAFFALSGERFDGHDFLKNAVDNGASVLVVDDRKKATKLTDTRIPMLLVDDTLRTIHDLARVYRRNLKRSGTKVIAVTGSNGKTTTRRLIHAALSSHLTGTQSPKSFNNHIGAPLTLLAASPDDGFVVVEVGTNHPGEIAMLADIVRPDAAVVTNIGTAHIGNFGSREAIAAEKLSLVRFLTRGGVAVLPGDEPLAQDVDLPDQCTSTRFGQSEACDMVLKNLKQHDSSISFTIQSVREEDPFGGWQMKEAAITLPLLGKHNALNTIAAIGVAHWMCLDVEDPKVAEALADIEPADMRLNVQTVGHKDNPVTLIVDCYNANRDSVAAALDVLAHYPIEDGQRRIAILGDMLELGDRGPELHEQIGRLIGESQDIDQAILIGELSAHTARSAGETWDQPRLHHFNQWSDQLPEEVTKLLEPGDVVLLKASRSVALERLIPEIEKRTSRRKTIKEDC